MYADSNVIYVLSMLSIISSETQETQFILGLERENIKLFYLQKIVRLSGPRLFIFSYIFSAI